MRAYAKLNLDLMIRGKLENGYHEISSTFQAISLYDGLEIRKAGYGYELTGSICSHKEKNIVSIAKSTLEEFVGRELPCKINLIKGIPIGAGLGGGSSDAASTLIGLNNLYNIDLSLEKLSELGLKVGADVPFFINGISPAKVTGIGEKISKAHITPLNYYLLFKPDFVKSTKEMYSLYDDTGFDFLTLTRNLCKECDSIYSFFLMHSDVCGVSGSGPMMFAGFDRYDEAQKVIKEYGLTEIKGSLFLVRPSKRTFEILFN